MRRELGDGKIPKYVSLGNLFDSGKFLELGGYKMMPNMGWKGYMLIKGWLSFCLRGLDDDDGTENWNLIVAELRDFILSSRPAISHPLTIKYIL